MKGLSVLLKDKKKFENELDRFKRNSPKFNLKLEIIDRTKSENMNHIKSLIKDKE